MAKDPRFLLHFKTLANFKAKLNDGTINADNHIAFIKDEQLFWCRGLYYSDFKKLEQIENINPNLTITKIGNYNYELNLKSKSWDNTNRTYKDKDNKHKFLSKNGVVLRPPTSAEGDLSIVFDFSASDCADKVLVTPTISPKWTFTTQNGTSVTASSLGITDTNTNITIETGYKVNLSATFKWVHDNNKKDPTSTNGSFGTALPASNVNSATSTKTGITTTTTYTLNLVAPKKGFMIGSDNKTIVAATGNDTTSASVKVTFGHRYYCGVSASATPTEAIIKALGKTAVVTGRALTVTGITTTSAQYYVYAYPQALGTLSSIIQDGATPITNAFRRTSVTITNAAGASIPLYVYTSVNPGAFNNAKIAFS